MPPERPPSPQSGPRLREAALAAGTLQGPLDGAVEVQRGLRGEASLEVDVADARDPHRMAAAAVDLAQAQAHVTEALDTSTQLQGAGASPARPGVSTWNSPALADLWVTYLLPADPARRSPNKVEEPQLHCFPKWAPPPIPTTCLSACTPNPSLDFPIGIRDLGSNMLRV